MTSYSTTTSTKPKGILHRQRAHAPFPIYIDGVKKVDVGREGETRRVIIDIPKEGSGKPLPTKKPSVPSAPKKPSSGIAPPKRPPVVLSTETRTISLVNGKTVITTVKTLYPAPSSAPPSPSPVPTPRRTPVPTSYARQIPPSASTRPHPEPCIPFFISPRP